MPKDVDGGKTGLRVLEAEAAGPHDDPERRRRRRAKVLYDHESSQDARPFAAEFWPAKRVECWIAFRNPELLFDDWRHAPRHTEMRETHPTRVMQRAVRRGELIAIWRGRELPRECWAAEAGRQWPDDVRFRREDVLSLWKDPNGSLAAETGPRAGLVQPQSGDGVRRRPTDKAVFKWHAARVKSWKGTPPTEDEDLKAARASKLGAARRKQIRAARQNAPSDWRKKGPRKPPREMA